jgi:hypothetical protein
MAAAALGHIYMGCHSREISPAAKTEILNALVSSLQALQHE